MKLKLKLKLMLLLMFELLNFEFINLYAIKTSHFNNSMRSRQNSTNVATLNFSH